MPWAQGGGRSLPACPPHSARPTVGLPKPHSIVLEAMFAWIKQENDSQPAECPPAHALVQTCPGTPGPSARPAAEPLTWRNWLWLQLRSCPVASKLCSFVCWTSRKKLGSSERSTLPSPLLSAILWLGAKMPGSFLPYRVSISLFLLSLFGSN